MKKVYFLIKEKLSIFNKGFLSLSLKNQPIFTMNTSTLSSFALFLHLDFAIQGAQFSSIKTTSYKPSSCHEGSTVSQQNIFYYYERHDDKDHIYTDDEKKSFILWQDVDDPVAIDCYEE